jgi:hypothetical protein
MNLSALMMFHLNSTLLMAGLIWFVQIVHYPLMAGVGRGVFRDYARLHQMRTTWVVAGPMLVELGTGAWLLAVAPELRATWSFIAATMLLAVIWASTAWWQVPIHRALAEGYDGWLIRRLVRSNWVRTLAWSGRAALLSVAFESNPPAFTQMLASGYCMC